MALNNITDVKTYGIESLYIDGVQISPVEDASTFTLEPIVVQNSLGGNTVVGYRATFDTVFAQNKYPDYASNMEAIGKTAPDVSTYYDVIGFDGLGDGYSIRINPLAPVKLGVTNEGVILETVERRIRARHRLVVTYSADLMTSTEWSKLFTAI